MTLMVMVMEMLILMLMLLQTQLRKPKGAARVQQRAGSVVPTAALSGSPSLSLLLI